MTNVKNKTKKALAKNQGQPDQSGIKHKIFYSLPNSEGADYLVFLSIFLLIYDVDIGHQQPNLTILNGSLAEFSVDETWSGSLVTQLI